MKRTLISLFISVFLLTTQTSAQTYSWQQTNGPEGGRPQDILLLNSETMIVSMFDGVGVYRSTNGGSTWVRLPPQTPYFYSYVANSAGKIYGGTYGGVHSSTDAGLSWTLAASISQETVISLCFDSTGRIFGGTAYGVIIRSTDGGTSWVQVALPANPFVWELAVTRSGAVFAVTSVGVFRSTDGGGTWLQINNGLTSTDVSSIVVTPSLVFIGTTGGGVFRSDNFGNTWTPMKTGLTSLSVHDLAIGTFGQLYAATTNGVFRSVDNGSNWSLQANIGLLGSVLRLTANSSGTLIAGSTFGLFSSSDFGNSWVQMNSGIKATYVQALAMNPNGYVFAGAMGIHRSSDLGNTWSSVGLRNNEIRSIAATSTPTLYAGTYAGTNAGLSRSTDNGTTWQATSITGTCVVATGEGGKAFAGSLKGVLRSTNYGVSWDSVNSGLPRVPYNAIAVSSSGYVYAATESSGLYSMTVDGNTWTKTNLSKDATALLCSGSATIFAGVRAAGVYRSTNYGSTWTQMNIGSLAGATVESLTMDKQGTIFAGFGWGMYRSTDGGDNWTAPNQGLDLPYHDIKSLLALPSGSVLAGTAGYGVFIGTPAVTGIVEAGVPTTFALSQNYPNPFNPSTTISYALPMASNVSLKIFNTLGQLIVTLVDGMKEAGTYQVQWHAADAPSGIYFYRLQAGDFVETNRMILLR